MRKKKKKSPLNISYCFQVKKLQLIGTIRHRSQSKKSEMSAIFPQISKAKAICFEVTMFGIVCSKQLDFMLSLLSLHLLPFTLPHLDLNYPPIECWFQSINYSFIPYQNHFLPLFFDFLLLVVTFFPLCIPLSLNISSVFIEMTHLYLICV